MKNYLNLKRVKNFIVLRFEKVKQNIRMYFFYKNLIDKNSICFDVGANIGNRSDIFMKLCSKVVAIEPQKKCFEILQKKYGKKSNIILINKALGEKEGEAEIMISEATTVSSISKDWIQSVKYSGRFSDIVWQKGYIVPVVTLDSLILTYGLPNFCKIDVEGFEYQVLSGLSKPIKIISFEFTPEMIDSTISCINHLSGIGNYKYNYSLGESMKFELSEYVSESEIKNILSRFKDNTIFGDVYAKIIT
jgi:FkbM family methyltransferase